MFAKVIFLVILCKNINCHRPNVCNRFIDYFTMNPRNCWYNPDVHSNAKDMIRRHGYPLEEYEVATQDSYLLTMYRIPNFNNKGIVYLQHPATTTCTGWIDKGNDSLAFMLWNEGYDIWLGNFRGTYYSRKHKYLNPDGAKYWDFSFNELGMYDVPDQIDLIVKITNAKPQGITFIGYSMSSTAALIYASEKPHHAAKWLNLMILMAPSAHVKHIHHVVKELSKSIDNMVDLSKTFNITEILAHDDFSINLQNICRNAPTMILCMIVDLSVFGNVPEELSPKWFPIMHYQVPGGMSLKPYLHYMQMVRAGGKFQKYDYGKVKNWEMYKSETPPEYDLAKISIPIYIMYADNDHSIHIKDVDHLYGLLPDRAKIYGKKMIRNFSHQSFFYGTHAVDWVYKPIIKLVNKVFSNN